MVNVDGSAFPLMNLQVSPFGGFVKREFMVSPDVPMKQFAPDDI